MRAENMSSSHIMSRGTSMFTSCRFYVNSVLEYVKEEEMVNGRWILVCGIDIMMNFVVVQIIR